MTVTGRSRPERKARKGQFIDTTDPAAARRRARHRTPRGPARYDTHRKDPTVSVNAWIVVGDQPAIGNLITVARSLGGPVGAVVAGPRSVAETVAASGVDRVVWCAAPDDVPAEANAPAVAQTVAADPPAWCWPAATPASGSSWAPPPPGSRRPSSPAPARSRPTATAYRGQRRFGDKAEETVAVSGPVALLLDGGSVPPPGGTTAPIEEVTTTPLGLKVIETRPSGSTRWT